MTAREMSCAGCGLALPDRADEVLDLCRRLNALLERA
jgi:hypothetical protein